MKQYDSYKDSDVEWIGKIPSHWETMKIKYVSSFNDDALPDNYDPEEVIEYVEISDVNYSVGIQKTTIYKFKDAPSRARRKTKVGDIIVSTVRTYLKSIARVDKPNLIVSTGFVVLRPRIDATFMAYAVNSEPFIANVVSQSVGVSYPAISSSQVVNIKISVPSLIEQQAIASFLDTQTARIDSIIASREKKIKLLEELRASIISQAITKGIRKDVEMKDSGIEWIGQIPKHWEVSVFKRFLKEPMKYGANESAEFDNPNWPRYIRITDIDEMGSLKKETFKSLPPEKAKEYLLEKGDVLFARSGATVGKTYIHRGEIKACYAGYLIKGKCKTSLLPEFLFLYTQTNAYDNWKNSVFIQATIQNIGADKYSVMPIVVPPIEEQKIIVEYSEDKISHINANIDKTRCEISLLKEYRASLITEVVTGKRKVTN